jgi:hypothetical protein
MIGSSQRSRPWGVSIERTAQPVAFWDSGADGVEPGIFVPGLLVTVDSFSAGCSGDFMLQLADHRAGRPEWDAAC